MREGILQPMTFTGSLTGKLRSTFGSQGIPFDDVMMQASPATYLAVRRQLEGIRYRFIGLRT